MDRGPVASNVEERASERTETKEEGNIVIFDVRVEEAAKVLEMCGCARQRIVAVWLGLVARLIVVRPKERVSGRRKGELGC